MTDAWQSFSAFQVYGDHVPMEGFSLMIRLAPDVQSMAACISERAQNAAPLDPEFTQSVIRSGIALAQVDGVSFVYASGQEAVVVLARGAVSVVGQSLLVHDFMVSRYAARLARLTGREIAVSGSLYEFPSASVVKKALAASMASVEAAAGWRAAFYVGSQVLGRGGKFDPQSIQTIAGQQAVLSAAQVDLDALPRWWRVGIAARSTDDAVELFDDLPGPEALGSLLVDAA